MNLTAVSQAGRYITHILRAGLIGALDHTVGQRCALCAQPVPTNERANNGWPNQICHWCVDSLPGNNRARCPICAIPVATGNTCRECRAMPPAFFATHVLADYAMPIDRMLQRFKYGSQLNIARTLGQAICQQLCSPSRPPTIQFPAWPELIVAVPLSANRLRERGYNQAALLARDIGKRLDIPLATNALLRVTNPDSSQTSKTRNQRLAAMKGQFRATHRVNAQRVLLIDDVMTTGATVNAAAAALLKQGAASVRVIAAARTP